MVHFENKESMWLNSLTTNSLFYQLWINNNLSKMNVVSVEFNWQLSSLEVNQSIFIFNKKLNKLQFSGSPHWIHDSLTEYNTWVIIKGWKFRVKRYKKMNITVINSKMKLIISSEFAQL